MRKNILITGQPKSGKSTLLANIIADIPNRVGFVTKEVLVKGKRTGFEMVTHRGTRAMLASTTKETPYQFSQYFVDVQALEAIIREVETFGEGDLLYIDEVAPLELFSNRFKKLVLKYMDANNVCVATIKLANVDPFIENIKKRSDVILVEITQNDREEQERSVRQLVKNIEKGK